MSGEFPTFKIRDDVGEPELVSAYVIHCLNSPQYLMEVDRDSTGSTKTSRNRYKQNRFLAMRVSVPRSIARLKTLVSLLEKASSLRARHGAILDQLKALNEAIAKMLPLADPLATNGGAAEVLANRKTGPPTTLYPDAKSSKPKPKRKRRVIP